jgi:hypothetical protein
VTAVQASTVCFVLLSQVVGVLVCCAVSVCVVLVRGLCSCDGVRFDVLCTNCYSFLNDIAVLCFYLK